MKNKRKFMKKSEREKSNIYIIIYSFLILSWAFLFWADLESRPHSYFINLDFLSIFSALPEMIFNLIGMFVLLVPINIIIFVSALGLALWFLNQTRYFAWPPDKFIHHVVQVSMIVALFETLITGWIGFPLNPLVHIVLLGYNPGDNVQFTARFFVFLTYILVPYLMYAIKTLDYNYLVALPVALETAFLSAIVGLFFVVLVGLNEGAVAVTMTTGRITMFTSYLAWYVAAITFMHFFGTKYLKEHQTALKAGTVFVEPYWQKVHLFGYYWRPGMKTEASSKRLLAILFIILIGLIVFLVLSGLLEL